MGNGRPESRNRMVMTDDIAERHLSLLLSSETMGREPPQHNRLRGDRDLVRALRGVNHRDAVRSLPCKGKKAPPDLPMKALGLSIETVLFAPRFPSAGEPDRHRQIEQEGEIWSKTAACHSVGHPKPVHIYIASISLVGKRGVREPVAEDDPPLLKGRHNDVRDMLAPCRKN